MANDVDINALKVQSNDSLYPYYLKISIGGVDIKNSNIVNLTIRETIFGILPLLELTFNDYGLFTDIFPLGDGDEVSIEISTMPEIEGIKTSFIINDYHVIPKNVDAMVSYIISVNGFLKSNSMFFPSQSRAFSRARSSDVLAEIFEDEGYEVKDPIITNDTMTWLQTNMSNFEMINRIIDYSYKEDGNIVFSFVDKNQNAYIKDLLTEIKKPKTFDIKQSTDPMTLYYTQLLTGDKQVKILGYNYFRMGFHPGSNNKSGGYGMRGYSYDYDSPKNFRMRMNGDIHPMTDYSLKNKEMVKLNSFSSAEQFPIKYKGSNFHINYHSAYLQNKFIRKTFFSDVLIVNSYFNSEVKLLDKVNVDINALARSGANTEEINKVYSGEYLVVGIQNQVTNGGHYKSILYLSRGGINQSAISDKTEMKLSDSSTVQVRKN